MPLLLTFPTLRPSGRVRESNLGNSSIYQALRIFCDSNWCRKSLWKYSVFYRLNALLAATPVSTPNDALFPSLLVRKELLNGDWIVDEKKLHSALSKPRKYLQAILEAAGRPKGTLHSFRVTYNNSLRDIGVSIQDRKILLAHSSVSTTEIYTLPNLELARSYVNQLPIPGEKFELNGS